MLTPFRCQAIKAGKFTGDDRLWLLTVCLEDEHLAELRQLPEHLQQLDQIDARQQINSWLLQPATPLEVGDANDQEISLVGDDKTYVVDAASYRFIQEVIVHSKVIGIPNGPVMFMSGCEPVAVLFTEGTTYGQEEDADGRDQDRDHSGGSAAAGGAAPDGGAADGG